MLLPQPREIKLTGESFCLNDLGSVDFSQTSLRPNHPIIERLLAALEPFLQNSPKNNAIGPTPVHTSRLILRIAPHEISHRQGYHLVVDPETILLEVNTEIGLFYGVCTLIQIIEGSTEMRVISSPIQMSCIPCLEIHDWPDFPNRGVMLDISRDKVPSMETVFNLVDLLASWKINQLQLYTEHTFAYQDHREVWAEASPFTASEIQALDAFCRERYVELVPNQNSFGHMEHWLKHAKYRRLAEIPDVSENPSPTIISPSCLCPLDPGSFDLIRGLYDELLPNFSSHQLNVGCDETFELGKGRSKQESNRVGIGHVYLNYLLKLYKDVSRRGFTMQYWADMVLSQPELVPELPPGEMIALIWGYEADYPFEKNAALFAQSKLPFYVCPGTSSWNSIAGRTTNSLENLKNAARNGAKYNALGFLNTDWGDNGHWQVLPVSYLGMAAGAAFSWCYQANESIDIREALNRFAFQDPSGTLGNLAYDLGNKYIDAGVIRENSSILFTILQELVVNWGRWLASNDTLKRFNHILENIDLAAAQVMKTTSTRPDRELLVREFTLTIMMLKHSCMRALNATEPGTYAKSSLATDLQQIIDEFQSIWLLRNRPGGLPDSLSHFKTAKNEYQND